MEIVQRRVDGSDAERSSCRYKFVALRFWNGFPTLFFTLNPNDVHSPLTVLLANQEHTHVEKISLDFTDAEMHNYVGRARKGQLPCAQRACRTRSLGGTALLPYNCQASNGGIVQLFTESTGAAFPTKTPAPRRHPLPHRSWHLWLFMWLVGNGRAPNTQSTTYPYADTGVGICTPERPL